MAQMGSFVPASYANISICDKIFTRIGASDDLAGGKSTFMVEMWEVSNILKNATSKSLVLLDEVGRGTSTYDGLSIAWSVIEHISNKEDLRCKTLFATHYHELTKLEGTIKGVKNYSVAVKEYEDNIIFLRKIVEGGADQSYGIEVAKLAGLPEGVIERAKEILEGLEKNSTTTTTSSSENKVKYDSQKEEEEDLNKIAAEEISTTYEVQKEPCKKESYKESICIEEKIVSPKKMKKMPAMQLDFNYIEKESLLNEIANCDILNMTPLDAMNTLYKLVKEAKRIEQEG